MRQGLKTDNRKVLTVYSRVSTSLTTFKGVVRTHYINTFEKEEGQGNRTDTRTATTLEHSNPQCTDQQEDACCLLFLGDLWPVTLEPFFIQKDLTSVKSPAPPHPPPDLI